MILCWPRNESLVSWLVYAVVSRRSTVTGYSEKPARATCHFYLTLYGVLHTYIIPCTELLRTPAEKTPPRSSHTHHNIVNLSQPLGRFVRIQSCATCATMWHGSLRGLWVTRKRQATPRFGTEYIYRIIRRTYGDTYCVPVDLYRSFLVEIQIQIKKRISTPELEDWHSLRTLFSLLCAVQSD